MSVAFTAAQRLLPPMLRRSSSPSSRAITENFLLGLVSIDAVGRNSRDIPDAARGLDQAHLIELAYREGLAPLAYNTMTRTSFGAGCGIPVQKFQYLYYLTCRQNTQAYGQLREVLEGLHAAGIEPLVLKGAALASQVYPDPGLRPFADMDILVQKRHLGRAHQVLQDLGYGINYRGRPIAAPSSTDLRFRSARQYFHRDRSYLSIDLYWQLARYPYLADIDYEGLWERASQVGLAGMPARALSPEDAILHLSLDFTLAAWYGHPELRSLRDIAEIVHRQDVDWDSLASWVHRSALAPPLYLGCRLSQELLGAEIPEEALNRIHPGAGRRQDWAVKQLGKHIFDAGHPLQHACLLALLRLTGPEGYSDKVRWLAQLLAPPRELWGGIPRGLARVILGRAA